MRRIFVQRNFMGKDVEKRVPILFFEQEDNALPTLELQVGKTLRIGRPSNRYYQYIFTSLDFLNQTLNDLSELLGLEGTQVQVTGMIHLKEGNQFAVVQQGEGKAFFNKRQKLFVDATKALKHREVIIEN